jgi:hypothetical protein
MLLLYSVVTATSTGHLGSDATCLTELRADPGAHPTGWGPRIELQQSTHTSVGQSDSMWSYHRCVPVLVDIRKWHVWKTKLFLEFVK